MLTWPSIPEVVSGQVLGATQLNIYKSGIEYLLGESHAPVPLALPLSTSERYQTTWGTVWQGYLYHWSDQLYYLIRLRNQGSAYPARAQLVYLGDDGASHALFELAYIDNDWVVHSDTVDLSAAPAMTKGRAYLWSWQTRTDQETYNTCLQVWATSERGVLVGWTTPPTFSETTSDSAQLNVLQRDLDALRAAHIAPVASLHRVEDRIWENDFDYWHDAASSVWRYRPSRLQVRALLSASFRADVKWRVCFMDTAGHVATIYESDEIHIELYEPVDIIIDMASPAVQAALAAAGITLTPGDYYAVSLGMKKVVESPDAFGFDNAFFCQLPTQVPAPGWVVPKRFMHGDTDISPANLNAYSVDLGLLGPGGSEEFWGEIAPAFMVGLDPMYAYHRKRWLCYLHSEGARPQLHYGADVSTSLDLPRSTGWQNYDLTQVNGLAWGGLICVTGCTAAFECDVPVV